MLQKNISSPTLYQEYPKDTWDNNGIKYRINKIFEITHSKKVVKVSLRDLKDQVIDSRININGGVVCGSCYAQTKDVVKAGIVHSERVKKTNIEIPIILFKDKYKWRIVDGAHRVEKALDSNLLDISAKMISFSELNLAKV